MPEINSADINVGLSCPVPIRGKFSTIAESSDTESRESCMIAIAAKVRRVLIGCCNMRIFLAGVGCVGKTTVGARLAELLDCRFFDLDVEIERFFGTSIEHLRNSHLTPHSFRCAAARALTHVISREDSCNCIIALPPSGLMGGYWKVVNKTHDATIVVLKDTPENILNRITFYDIDSRPIQRNLTDREKRLYFREIRRDITYFSRSFQKAHVFVDIAGCGADEASRKVKDALALAQWRKQGQAPEQVLGIQH